MQLQKYFPFKLMAKRQSREFFIYHFPDFFGAGKTVTFFGFLGSILSRYFFRGLKWNTQYLSGTNRKLVDIDFKHVR